MNADYAHDILVTGNADDSDGPQGILIAKHLWVDGEAVLVPGGSKLTVETGNEDATTVTLTIFARSVRIIPETDEDDGLGVRP